MEISRTSTVVEPAPWFFPSLYSQLTNLDVKECVHFQLIKEMQTKVIFFPPPSSTPGNTFIHLGGIYRRVPSFFKVRIFLEIIKNSFLFLGSSLVHGLIFMLQPDTSLSLNILYVHILRKGNASKSVFYSYSYITSFFSCKKET